MDVSKIERVVAGRYLCFLWFPWLFSITLTWHLRISINWEWHLSDIGVISECMDDSHIEVRMWHTWVKTKKVSKPFWLQLFEQKLYEICYLKYQVYLIIYQFADHFINYKKQEHLNIKLILLVNFSFAK